MVTLLVWNLLVAFTALVFVWNCGMDLRTGLEDMIHDVIRNRRGDDDDDSFVCCNDEWK